MRGAILAAVIGAGGSAMGQAIPVDDPGFEETALTACSFTGAFGPSSAWRVPAGSGGAGPPSGGTPSMCGATAGIGFIIVGVWLVSRP